MIRVLIFPIQGEFNWNANYERVIENGLDFAHAPFVHSGSFGNPDLTAELFVPADGLQLQYRKLRQKA